MFKRQWQNELYEMVTGSPDHLVVSIVGATKQEKSEFMHATLSLVDKSWGTIDFWTMMSKISEAKSKVVIIDASISIHYPMDMFHMEEIIRTMKQSQCELFIMFNESPIYATLPNYIGAYMATPEGLVSFPVYSIPICLDGNETVMNRYFLNRTDQYAIA